MCCNALYLAGDLLWGLHDIRKVIYSGDSHEATDWLAPRLNPGPGMDEFLCFPENSRVVQDWVPHS